MPADPGRPRGLFVTGTDTGVGKTVVGAALAHLLATESELRIAVMKPVETGVDDPARPGPDAELLAWAAREPATTEGVAPLRFTAPLAPALAAEAAGTRIVPGDLVAAARGREADCDLLLVEGAGGLLVPLAGGYLMADLMRDLGYPLLVVCRPGLGTINHTLLTLMMARSLGLAIAGFVINAMPAQPGPAEASAPHALASLAPAELLAVLPQVAGPSRDQVLAVAAAWRDSPTLPLLWRALGLAPGPARMP